MVGKVRVGSIVKYRGCFGGGKLEKECDIDRDYGVIDLSNGHWCYFDQIKYVIAF